MKLLKEFNEKWTCHRCKRINIVKQATTKPYGYTYNHTCKCGVFKLLVNATVKYV